AVSLTVTKQSGSNEISTVDGVKAEIEKINKDLPPGVNISIISDNSVATRNSLAGVQRSLVEAVVLTGLVEDVRVPVAQAMACVVALRDGGGTRLKVLEAMALGTPVVATPRGAAGLDVVDGEHLLLAADPQTFARCTLSLLQDGALRARLAARARRLVEERYDWRSIGAHFVEAVEQCVVKKRRIA
ncbi:efflux RND transporter permease subunit, partial [Caldilinea sp.]|uniref:glycosyltransferase family 4 protein n=1 Tax=Caldilinea sp. TaxID=2293560 RepID=UPI002CC258B5|nr:efflux RND transporter permease subunit [Caldilinea sp.]